MHRRSLFDAPTNCTAQQLARLRVSVKANRDWLTVQPIILPPPTSCICCGVELEETRRGQ